MPLGAANLNLLGKYFAPVATGRSAIGLTAENDAQVDTAQSKFGGASVLMDGTGDTIRLGTNVDVLGVGTSDYTVEFWYRTTSASTNQCLFDQRDTAQGNWPAIFNNGSNIKMWWNGAFRLTNTTTISNNTWYHVALVRSSGDWKIYIDGSDANSGTYTGSASIEANTDATIGLNFNDLSGLVGHIDEFRISDVARYTSDFSPNNSQFVNDDNTLLLCHFDGADASTTFTDDVDSTVFELESVANTYNLTFNARSYQIPKISYAGDDSSGRPVFFVGTRSSAGDFVASLIRRNNDGSISESAVTTLKSTDERFEAQGVAGFDSSGNPVGVTVGTYRISGVIYSDIYCNQIDLDNLSLGTTYSSTDFTSVNSNAGFAYATYYGTNGKFGCGYRNSGIRTALVTVNSSSISVGNELHESSYGDGVYQGVYGLSYQNDSDYLHMSANGNGNQHGAGYFNGTAAGGSVYSDSITVGLARTEPFELAYNKMLTVARNGTNAEMIVSDITWPGTGNPTFTNGSVTDFGDQASWSSSFCGAADPANNVVYILYNHSTNGWQIKPITASGTTPSEGTVISVDVSTSNWGTGNEANAACFATSDQGDLFVALIDDTGGNNPQIYIGAV